MKRLTNLGLLILLGCLLTTKYSTAQNGYPKLIVLDNDTVAAYTEEQVQLINLMENQVHRYRGLSDELVAKIKSQDYVLMTRENALKLMYDERAKTDSLDSIYKELRANDAKTIAKLERKANRKDTWLKIVATVAVVEAVVLVVITQ